MTQLDQPNILPSRQRSWFARYWYVAVVLIGLVWLSLRLSFHAGYIDEDKQETIRLIEQFHARMNARQFDQIYDDSCIDFKNAGRREDVIKAMQNTHSRWGQFKQVTFSELNEIIGHQIQIRAVYNSTFEKGMSTEEFIFLRQGNKIQLAFYNILEGTVKPGNGPDAADLSTAKKAADEFYLRIAGKDYGAIWDAAHSDMKNSVSREQMIDMMQEFNDKLGACGVPKLVNTDYVIQNSDHFVGLLYRRKCEQTEIQERLAWKIINGKALLRGYH